MIAVNQQTHLYVHVLVQKDSDAVSLTSLKGETLALPAKTRGHALLYLERSLKTPVQDFSKVFGAVTTPDTAEDALDDVVDGVVHATVVDGVTLDCYKRRKPGRFAKLRDLEKSGAFPAAVVAYHEGAVDYATLERFQTGMQSANKSAFGRQLLTLWQMTAFEPVPADYQQTLGDMLKLYPAPGEAEAKK
jgi:ABC-type phosphate/phosphonate transport system substrate-binding protein